MILRSLTVKGWRCFVNETKVGPFDNGLNIIHGPNGIGKSSLIMALTRCLFDSHNVGGAGIKAIRSWGRELSPTVAIEFEQGDEQFKLFKQFLVSPTAQLSRKEDDKFVPLAESRAADDRARAILSGEASSRGVSDQRHWGFAQILWAPQGNLRINELASVPRATIQDSIGSQITGIGTEDLENKISEAYSQFFTRTGKIKRTGSSSPPIVDLQSRLKTEKERRESCRQQLQAFETASRRIEDLTAELKQAKQSEAELDSQLKTNREQVEKYRKLTEQKKQYQLELSSAEDRYNAIVERITAIADAETEQTEISQKHKLLSNDLPTLEKIVEQDLKASNNAVEQLKKTRLRRADVSNSRAIADLAERFTRNNESFAKFNKQIEQLEIVTDELKELRASRAKIVAPDKLLLKQITKIARNRDDARLRLNASLIRVKVKFAKPTTIDITQAEQIGQQILQEDQTLDIGGSPDVVFTIPGVGHFSATGPTSDFAKLHNQFESANSTFLELTSGFGSDDLATLEARHAEAESMDHLISNTEVKLDALLNGATLEQLMTKRSHAKNILDEIISLYPAWKQTVPNLDETARDAEDIEFKYNRDIDDAETASDSAKAALKRSEESLANRKSEIANLRSRMSATEKTLQSLQGDGLNHQARIERRLQVALERDAAIGKLKIVNERILQLGDDPAKSQRLLEEQLKAFRTTVDSANGKLNTETGRLEQIIADAPYSTLAASEEHIASLENQILQQQKQMDAIQLLYETVICEKSEVMNALVDPIGNRANYYLNRIVGSKFQKIDFDESLLPQCISPDQSIGGVDLEQISGGEQEQVHFAVRMALADIAFPKDRQPVVFDDVFTYTDASRLNRIANILEESAERFQIILLTCHPERYRGLANAKFFDLEEIVNHKTNL